MISYREKQLLAVMKYMQDQSTDLAKQISLSIGETNKGKCISFDSPAISNVDSFEELCQLAENAGYDIYIRAEDILSPEEIADLEQRKEEINKQFETQTKLQKKDIELLFLATGLQIARWAIITTIKPLSLDYTAELTPRSQRLTHTKGDDLVKVHTNNIKNDESAKAQIDTLEALGEKHAIKKIEERKELIEKYKITNIKKAKEDYSNENFRTVQQILFRPVPYDAENSTNEKTLLCLLKGLKICGTNHRAYTMGHDPIFGWIFGPINIMTRSITFKNTLMSTFPVLEKGNIITFPKSNIIHEIRNALKSWHEDNKRFKAAIIKQTLHCVADKYTKVGLPIPFITAEEAQQLIEQDWNSVEAKKWLKKALHTFSHDATTVALEFFLSHYINELISILHNLIYHVENDYDPRLLNIRTKKIISISNTISSCSNIVYSAAKAYITQNPISGIQVLDIGGLTETIYRLVTNTIFTTKLKDEFIKSTINDDFQNKLNEIESYYSPNPK